LIALSAQAAGARHHCWPKRWLGSKAA